MLQLSKYFPSFIKASKRSANTPSAWTPASTLSNPLQWMLDLLSNRVRSGVVVNQRTVLGIAAAWCAIRILSETMASLPLHVYEQQKNGDIRRATNHPVDYLISTEPSKLYSSFTFRETCQAHLCTRGNAYARIIRDGGARPVELKILDPIGVDPILNVEGELKYWVSSTGEVLDPIELLHIPALAMNGLKGLSPISAHRENLGMSLSAVQYGANFFGNGAHLHNYIAYPGKLKEDARKNLKKSISNAYSGLEKTGELMLLEEGVELKQISLSPQDAMLIETRKMQVDEIARIFRVPPHLLYSLERATYSNIEHQSTEFVVHTMRPWVKRWEQEINRKLFRESEKGRFFVRFNLDALLRGDMKARAQFYKDLFGIGVLSQNDIRGLENLNPIDGGDRYFVPLNMISKKELDKISKPKS